MIHRSRLYGILLQSSTANEVTGVFSEHPFIEVPEHGFSVDVVRENPGPIVVATITGGSLGESLEFAGCIPSVVLAIATAVLPFLLVVPLERTRA